ncbi:hypothetical protein N7532_008251 [Penicillium argentinense]|uniref:Uncharacterized protein n=1 Tax=Penicillium argentinense TaxID=1131581 RepID=A0A9W9K2C0_9EURO|nr:uncharacterized protein N7532_008251 [Penicillium argentinense]KAJ5089567.1 hypothetical protein N7532_008251 [Penicillium argentinense]
MSSVLITGASRGLGLELVKQYSCRVPDDGLVIAAARNMSPELGVIVNQEGSRVVFVAVDISNESSVLKSTPTVTTHLRGKGLDILINNAGVHSWTDGGVSQMSDLGYQLRVNVTGTHNMIRSYLPLLQSANVKKVINISSPWGSTSSARDFYFAPCPAYKISKAALNSLTVQYALSHEAEGFTFLSVNPGWLRTDMGGSDGDLSAEEGASAVADLVASVDTSSNGSFKTISVSGYDQYSGQTIPW